MEGGSSSKNIEKAHDIRKGRPKPSSWPPKVEPFVPRTDHNPRELKAWAKRTGFNPTFSGETASSISERDPNEKNNSAGFDIEKGLDGRGGSSPKIEIDPILGRTKGNRGAEIEPVSGPGNGRKHESVTGDGLRSDPQRVETQKRRNEPLLGSKDDDKKVNLNGNGNGNGNAGRSRQEAPEIPPTAELKRDDGKIDREEEIEDSPDNSESSLWGRRRPSGIRCRLRENPGPVHLMYYGLQHYLSLAGSLIFIPIVMVPAMGGTDKDTATVISTMLLVSGITTILHSYFGTRLPLVQGSSFVYLAPALVIMNSQDYRNLSEHKFRLIMKELQGAIIIGSIFQSFLGYSGLMSLLLRLINPIVVAPTVAAVGLAFFSYGFPQAGTCVEIGLPQILLVLIFSLYLQGVSIFGHRIFRVYAVPLSVAIIWAYAFFLTAGGAYNYKGCNANIPSSNILSNACRKHAFTMKHCRTDASSAWSNAAWVRVPYPLQWGIPTFHLRTSIIMIIVSLVATVDSVGTYHSASLLVNSRPPTPGIVSRGIGLEGFCSLLAGLWGTGTGSTTLTENLHTIDITKVASRRAIELGAVLLIFFSFIGKVGAILASIPQALAASLLCFIWALIVALGLSTLQYGQAASFRNITIVGVSLFLSLSIPAYFQQYQPNISFVLPSYFVPYAAASNGPVHTGSRELDFAINGLLSLNMVVGFLLAFILDNTVPGSRQERGVYIWSSAEDLANDSSILADYSLPTKVGRYFRWAKCVGA
ncbi:nucleobase-ascorbate transporter 11 [Macadamia integrifolia]|uniref:nucleobase-ascorbate transporter 11 n=1 Tax=Macadamia integrifolia TaxID=60698 RepID=UPI001C4E4DE6|nr:nucleobase-ascorbate transporter 11 [Macadamia integrifolia]